MSIEEQLTQQSDESIAPETSGHATRDDLIAAVRAAGGVESVTAEPEETAAAPTEPETPAPPAEEDRVERLLRAREKAHAETMAARRSADDIRARAEAEGKRIIEEAKAEARRAVEEEQRARRQRLDESPIEALRELGRDPGQMVDAVLQANTPEARERARLAAEIAETRKDAAQGKTALDELNKLRADINEERQQLAVEQVRSQFLSTVATAEKAPYLHAVADVVGTDVFAMCDSLCRKWTAEGLVLNGQGENGFAPGDLVAYLERQSKERIVKVSPQAPPAQQVAAGAVARPPGNAPQVSANGPRTLSAAAGSERRSAPKPFHQLDAAQKRQALIEEVAAERRRNPDALD